MGTDKGGPTINRTENKQDRVRILPVDLVTIIPEQNYTKVNAKSQQLPALIAIERITGKC